MQVSQRCVCAVECVCRVHEYDRVDKSRTNETRPHLALGAVAVHTVAGTRPHVTLLVAAKSIGQSWMHVDKHASAAGIVDNGCAVGRDGEGFDVVVALHSDKAANQIEKEVTCENQMLTQS